MRPTRHRMFLRRLWYLLLAGAMVGVSQLALADSEYARAWGPSVGIKAPLLSANDQQGKPQTMQTLMGTHGLLVVFNRSVDW